MVPCVTRLLGDAFNAAGVPVFFSQGADGDDTLAAYAEVGPVGSHSVVLWVELCYAGSYCVALRCDEQPDVGRQHTHAHTHTLRQCIVVPCNLQCAR